MSKCSFVSCILWNNLSLCCPAFLSFPTKKHAASALLFASSKFSLKLNSKFMQAYPSQTSIYSSYHVAASVLSDKGTSLLQLLLLFHYTNNLNFSLLSSETNLVLQLFLPPTDSYSFLYFYLQRSFLPSGKSPTPPTLSSPVAPAALLFPLEQHADQGIATRFTYCQLLSSDANFASYRDTQSKTSEIISKTNGYLTSKGISQVRVWNSYQIAIIVFLLPVVPSNRLYFHLLKRKKKKNLWEMSGINFFLEQTCQIYDFF